MSAITAAGLPRDPPLTALRLTLRRHGFPPVPISRPNLPVRSAGKRPLMKDWQTICATADEATVRAWATEQPDCPGTGILCGRVVGLDIDVPIAALAARIEALATTMLGHSPLRRVGNAPKTLLVFRTSTPLPKLETPELFLPDGTKLQVEALGHGQQFVAFGVHPDTHQDYQWTEGGLDLLGLDDLPLVDATLLRAFLDDAETILRAAGGLTQQAERSEPEPQDTPARPASGPRSGVGGEDFFRAVNQAALNTLAAWVPKLFPKAKLQQGTRAYRITSDDLGRDYQEDLSIHPDGVQDFGARKGMSPCDLLMEWGNAPTVQAAAHTLCEWLGRPPTDFGWKEATTKSRTPTPPDTDSEPWPEPVDVLADQDPGAAPILADRHVPAVLWPFIADSSERMGAATSTIALCAIVACASAISKEWRLQPKQFDPTWTERACLWAGVIGDPGTLKSPVLALTTAPIDTLEANARRQWQQEMEGYRAELAAWKENKEGREPKRPLRARHLIESTTVEALQEVLRDDGGSEGFAPLGKVLSKQDELAEFLASMDKYSTGRGGSDRGAHIRLYDGGRFTIDRIGRGAFACNSWSACLMGGIQPEPIQRIARDAVDDGLIQRLALDVPPARGTGQDRAPNRAALGTYHALFPVLSAMRPARGGDDDRFACVVLHRDAHPIRESIDAFAHAMSVWPDASPQLRSTFGKWHGLFGRLCLTFHLIEVAAAKIRGDIGPHLDVVPAETAARVRTYMREILAPMLLRGEAIMFASRQTTHATWIAKYIIANGMGRITARDISRDYRALKAPEQRDTLDSTMDSLCTFGWLRPEPPRGGATRPTAWRVNPAVHTAFAERATAERARRDAVRAEIAAHVAELRARRS